MINSDRIIIIGAHTYPDHAFGLGDGMPWPKGSLVEDMQHFKNVTITAPEGKKNLLIAGRKTFESIGGALPKRYMGVISREFSDKPHQIGADVFGGNSVLSLLEWAEHNIKDLHNIFFIGGELIWMEGFNYASHVHVTIVHKSNMRNSNLRKLRTPLTQLASRAGFIRSIDTRFVNSNWGEDVVRLEFAYYWKYHT